MSLSSSSGPFLGDGNVSCGWLGCLGNWLANGGLDQCEEGLFPSSKEAVEVVVGQALEVNVVGGENLALAGFVVLALVPQGLEVLAGRLVANAAVSAGGDGRGRPVWQRASLESKDW